MQLQRSASLSFTELGTAYPSLFLRSSAQVPAEVAVLWPLAIPNNQPPPNAATTPWGLNEAIYWPNFDKTLKVGFWGHPQQIPTVMVIFVQAPFVLVTFIHKEYLSCYWPDFDETLKVGSWEHIKQILTVEVTFVLIAFVLVTFVHMRNISTVTGMIWT